ncbi:MAG: hypothetical protein R2838_25515 [Caldilineaceae bacterium]
MTHDMTGYHAFNRIGIDTPAAILEDGISGGDRELLEGNPSWSPGVVDSILCFGRRRRRRRVTPIRAAASAFTHATTSESDIMSQLPAVLTPAALDAVDPEALTAVWNAACGEALSISPRAMAYNLAPSTDVTQRTWSWRPPERSGRLHPRQQNGQSASHAGTCRLV